MKEFAHKHCIICPLAISLLISIMYITNLPLALVYYEVAGNNIFVIFNMIVTSLLCIILVKALYPKWIFGFQCKGLAGSLLKYG
jgi:hypothetical protein